MDFSYYLKKTSLDKITIMPAVGRKFTDSEFENIKNILENISGIETKINGSSISVFSPFRMHSQDDIKNIIEDELPKRISKAILEDIIKEKARLERKAKNDERVNKVISSNSRAALWVHNKFGLACMNNFNKSALIEYLSGATDDFYGMFNHSAGVIALSMGAVVDGKYDFLILKNQFLEYESEMEGVITNSLMLVVD